MLCVSRMYIDLYSTQAVLNLGIAQSVTVAFTTIYKESVASMFVS